MSADAQILNGSFEDDEGNFDTSGWTSTCPMVWGPAAPGYGDFGALVNHSNAGCDGWSRATHPVPEIADGETWILRGWTGVFTWPFFSPQVGFGLGWKEADGTLHFFTAPVTQNGSYTFLQVTNTFALAPGDTAFVELDPGTSSGGSGNQLFAMYDGLELELLSTGAGDRHGIDRLALHPNPAQERLWVACAERCEEVRVIDAAGRVASSLPFNWRDGTAELDMSDLVPGPYTLWVRTGGEVRTARIVKQ